jgi:hypothetical protein
VTVIEEALARLKVALACLRKHPQSPAAPIKSALGHIHVPRPPRVPCAQCDPDL